MRIVQLPSVLCCVLGPDRTQLSILMYSARCVYFSFRWPWGPPAFSSWWETDSSTSLTVSRLEMKERKKQSSWYRKSRERVDGGRVGTRQQFATVAASSVNNFWWRGEHPLRWKTWYHSREATIGPQDETSRYRSINRTFMKLKLLTDRFIRIHGSCRAGGVRLSLAPLDFIYLFILGGRPTSPP